MAKKRSSDKAPIPKPKWPKPAPAKPTRIGAKKKAKRKTRKS